MPRWKAILAEADRLLFPPVCLACNARIDQAGQVLCGDCRNRLVRIDKDYCPRCGGPLLDYHCPACAEQRFAFDFARAAYVYESPVRELVHAFKYSSLRSPAAFFTPAMLRIPAASRLAGHFDFVMAVPLHPVRQRERGYNQSALLARQLARELRIRYSNPVRRVHNTASQTNLSREARLRNLDEAFALKRKAEVAGRRVLLVDDVFTTGTTVNEIAKLLKKAGAAKVAVLTASRAT